jgi:hypothetical protein
MAIYDFFLSRNNGPTIDNYVGHAGRLFYDPAERVLRISDGVTTGGEVFNGIVTVANTEPTANFPGQIWLDPQTYELWVYHNGDFIPTIDVATETKLGGIKLGPGVTLNGDGQIIIDSEGLDFSFGNFAATVGTYPADYYESARQDDDYAVLSSINANEDIIFASNGTGAVRVVGDFSVRRANGNLGDALEEEPIFRVKSDGQVQLLVPSADAAEGAFTIVGGLEGVFQAPVNTGVMMHITGIASSPDPTPSRIYNDAQNSFSAIVSRRYNGTAAAPTAVLANEEIMRLSGTAHNGTLIPGVANQRIIYKALGNQTTSNQGGSIELWATPINTITLAKIATVDSVGITLESGKVLTGNVTGNASTVTNGVYTTDTGTVTNTMLANSSVTVNGTSIALGASGTVTAAAATLTGTTLAATVVTSSLTTVGTLGSLTVTNLVTAKNYSGQVRNLGTITAGVGTEITIDFATDHMVRFNYTTEPVQVAFTNYSAGKTVTLIAINTNAANRQLQIGIAAANTQGVTTLDINGNTTGIVTYYCTGTTVDDVFASTVYVI